VRPLLDRDINPPMLVINGADDVHHPAAFEGRRQTRAELLPDTGRCATTKPGEAVPAIAGWITERLPSADRPAWSGGFPREDEQWTHAST
jgi:esterase FrsA